MAKPIISNGEVERRQFLTIHTIPLSGRLAYVEECNGLYVSFLSSKHAVDGHATAEYARLTGVDVPGEEMVSGARQYHADMRRKISRLAPMLQGFRFSAKIR